MKKKQSKAKQRKAEQCKAEQSKAKQSKAKQNKAKQSKAKQSKAKKSKQSKAKQSKAKQRGHGNLSKRQSMQHTLMFRQIPGSPGQNLQFRLCNYVRNLVIFHLTPVSSKNLEKRRRSSDLKKIISRKRISRARGFPEFGKKLKNLFVIFLKKNVLQTF